MARPNVVKLVGVDSKNGEIVAAYISHELSGYKGKFVPDRPHGEWVYKKFDKKTGISDSYFCSRCDFPLTGIYKFYCAVCGADMRKEGDKNE